MKVSYFRELKNHHMVVTAGGYLCPEYQMEMLQQNDIKGLLRPSLRQVNEETEYDYGITGCQSLQTFIETAPISGEVLKILIGGLCRVLEELERYMIDGEYLTLRPEYIYLERDGESIKGIYYCIFPFQSQEVEKQIQGLMKIVLDEVDYQEKETVDLAYELFQEASQEPLDLTRMQTLVKNVRSCELPQDSFGEVPVLGIAANTLPGNKTDGSSCSTEVKTLTDERTEEILWAEPEYEESQEKIKYRKKADRKAENRKSGRKNEIALPDQGKKSILNIISRR